MTDALPTTIHVVDDDPAFRRSLVFLLESVGWEVADHPSAEAFLACQPHISDSVACLVLDIRMPAMSGLALQQILHERGWPLSIVFITGHGDVAMAVQAMKTGCCDFLEKPFKDQALLDAVEAAVRHTHVLRRAAGRKAQARERLERLSPREDEVARLVALGLSNKQVARDLGISERTVHIHRQHVMEKTGAGGAAGLARLMLKVDAAALDALDDVPDSAPADVPDR